MEKSEFIKMEYEALRAEIDKTKERIYQLTGLGGVLAPVAFVAANSTQNPTLILALPILVFIISYLYISECRSMMRCGQYIRTVIEDEVKDFKGWEKWLEESDDSVQDKRFSDKLISSATYFLFILYFAISMVLIYPIAIGYVDKYIFIAFAFIFLMGFAYLLKIAWPSSTSTSSTSTQSPKQAPTK